MKVRGKIIYIHPHLPLSGIPPLIILKKRSGTDPLPPAGEGGMIFT
jgi:hypothetical protein